MGGMETAELGCTTAMSRNVRLHSPLHFSRGAGFLNSSGPLETKTAITAARSSSLVVEISVPDEMPTAITEALEEVASDTPPGTTINGAPPLWILQQARSCDKQASADDNRSFENRGSNPICLGTAARALKTVTDRVQDFVREHGRGKVIRVHVATDTSGSRTMLSAPHEAEQTKSLRVASGQPSGLVSWFSR